MVSRIRYNLRHTLGRSPALYLPLARLRHGDKSFSRAVRPQTEIVIEGFPRSANTFAVAAFRRAQPKHVEIAHHLHLAVQVLYAIKHNIPALVLIREPEPAMLSYMLLPSYPSSSPRHALSEYVRFYETLEPYRDRFVLADFHEVVQDFGSVIQRINRRYGTDFQIFKHTSENIDACFEEAESASRRQNEGQVSSRDVARPDAKRDQAKLAVRQRLHARHFQVELARAQSIYRRLTTR